MTSLLTDVSCYTLNPVIMSYIMAVFLEAEPRHQHLTLFPARNSWNTGQDPKDPSSCKEEQTAHRVPVAIFIYFHSYTFLKWRSPHGSFRAPVASAGSLSSHQCLNVHNIFQTASEKVW